MLSQLQQRSVWEGWLGSEIRANYFAELAGIYHRRQRLITWLTLAFSSGAFATLIADWLPAALLWIRPALAAVTAALSLWSLVAQYSKNAYDCSDLHLKWHRLATDYEALWDRMYDAEAPVLLSALTAREAEVSKAGTHIPYVEQRMERWEDHVVAHHQLTMKAA